jgi:O-antigen/teichoic acid export membrane protein
LSLRDRILRGGTYLIVRQGLGVVLSVVGVVLITRLIGPEAYGLYAGPLGIYTFLLILSQWGVDVYLIRHEGELQDQDYHQAFTLLLLLGLATTALASAALPLLSRWVGVEGFGQVALVLFAGLTVQLVGTVPQSRLERALDYRRVTIVSLSAQTLYFMTAVALAYQGLGAWAPVVGWWAQVLLTSGLLYLLTAYRPRIYWAPARIRAMVGYGLGYSASTWVYHLRLLVNPLVVGRYAGVEAVGYVALAIRIIDTLSTARWAGWRLSIAALGRLQSDRARLVSALSQGMQLQVLAVGLPLVGFALVGAWMLPLLLGPKWLPVLEVYPFLALGSLANSIFSLHSSALYVLRRNWDVAIFHVAYITLFAGGALLLVSRAGMVGYGWAEVLTVASYGVIHFFLVREIGRPSYRLAFAWGIAFALVFFWRELGWAAGLGIVVIALWPETWRALRRYAKDLRRALHG